MNRNKNFTLESGSVSNLRVCTNKTSPPKSKELISKPLKVKELFNRNLNTSLLKLCSDADMRIKVLLSNKASGIKSTSYSNVTLSELNTLTKDSSLDTSTETMTLDTSKTTTIKSTKHKNNSSFHFNTEIDKTDDPTIKQLTVLKILKLTDLASKIEKRQNTLAKSQFESSSLQRSYIDGLEEGFRYGYFDDPNEKHKTRNEGIGKSNSTFNENDKIILKSNDEELQPENKESKRMRGGFQNSQQKEKRLQNKFAEDVSKLTEPINELKRTGVTITDEYPNKCTENVNVQALKQNYEKKNDDASVKNLNGIERGELYLRNFDKMLASMGEIFSKSFRAGFGDGFVAANVFVVTDTEFSEEEQKYMNHMRKCLNFSEINLNNDVKNIRARVDEMKKNINITNDEFEDILNLISKGIIKKVPLKFSKNDYKHYTDAAKRNMEYMKIKSSYEDENSEMIFASTEEEKQTVILHTKNRALKYFKKHRINEFFQFLGSHLVATKPDDPISFLVNLLEKCLEYRFNEFVIQAPLLFTKKHVESVYFVLDPMVTGYIDISQYSHGMEALGLNESEDVSLNSNFRPGEKIDKYVFVTNACRRLLCNFREMIASDNMSALPSKITYTYTNVSTNENF